jgi:hypothetical protein
MDDEDMWVRLRWVSDEFKQGITQAKSQLTNWRDETNASTGEMAKWGAAIGATAAPFIAVGYAIYSTVEKYGKMAQQLRDLSYSTGLSTDKLQQLQYAATISGTNFDRVSYSVGNLNLKISEAGDKTSAAAKAFSQLGINTSGKSPDQVFEETAQALIGLEDSTTRAKLANELFGRSWREVLPFLQEYIDRREEINKHPTISSEDLRTLSEYKSTIDGITSGLDLMIAKLVVAAEKSVNLAAAGTGLRGTETEMRGGIGVAQRSTDIMARKFGSLSGPSSPDIMEDPFKGLTAKEAEIKYLTDVTIPALEKALLDAEMSGDLQAAQEASLKLLQARETATASLTDATDKLSDKSKEYADSLRKVDEEMRDQQTLTRDYLEDVMFAGRDVSRIRSLTQNYKQAMRTEDDQLQDAYGRAQEAGTAMVAAGGTVEGDIWNVTVTASKDYPMADIVNDLKALQLSKSRRIQAGVRTP